MTKVTLNELLSKYKKKSQRYQSKSSETYFEEQSNITYNSTDNRDNKSGSNEPFVVIESKESLYADLPKEKKFFTRNGKTISNLMELYEKLKIMPEEEFQAHVNEEKDDFAKWIDEVLKEKSLADIIRGLKQRDELVSLLAKEIEKVNIENNDTEPKVSPTRKTRKKKKRIRKILDGSINNSPKDIIKNKGKKEYKNEPLQEKNNKTHEDFKDCISSFEKRLVDLEKNVDVLKKKFNNIKEEEKEFLEHVAYKVNEKDSYIKRELYEIENLEREVEWRRKHVFFLEKSIAKKEEQLKK